MTKSKIYRGGCLCGGVAFEFDGQPEGVVCCHCRECRRQTGHHFATVGASRDRFRLTSEETLTWYQVSPAARRGFCSRCGSSLFWDEFGSDGIDVLAGSIEGNLGVKVIAHVFAAEKGDYYEIAGDAPRYEKGRKG